MSERCVAGERCLAYDRREKVAAETDRRSPLCEAELLAGERAVPQLVMDYRDLEQYIPPALGVWGDGQPSARDEHRVPMNLAVEALQAEIWWVLTTWEQVVREADRLSDALAGKARGGWAVHAAATILAPRIRLLAAIPETTLADYPRLDDDTALRLGSLIYADVPGWQGVLDLARLHNRARYMLGLTAARPEPIDGVPCKNVDCDEKDLYRDLVAEEVFCGSCGKRMSKQEYEAWTKLVSGHVKPKKGKAA